MFATMENYLSQLEGEVKNRMARLEKKRNKGIPICHLPHQGSEQCASGRVRTSWNCRVVADALKVGVAVAPETHDGVLIYTIDAVDFKTTSAMATPPQIVDLLNSCYTLFDRTVACYDVYKPYKTPFVGIWALMHNRTALFDEGARRGHNVNRN
ncbi:Retinal guanylyl cyclase 1 [Taenia solium]|eukprot:TsM_000270600 transcript=TsM_000270600 gene=TsM_000270600